MKNNPSSSITKYDPSVVKFGEQYILSTGHVGFEAVGAIGLGLAVMALSGTPIAALPVGYWILNNLVALGKDSSKSKPQVIDEEEEYQEGRSTIQLGGSEVNTVYEREPIVTPAPVSVHANVDPWDFHQQDLPVGQTTAVSRLRSTLDLDVAASRPAYEPRLHPEKPVIHTTTELEKPLPLCDRIVDNLESLLIIGNPGAGKAMLMSNLVPLVRAKYPEIKIVGIDPKGDPKETGYWSNSGFDEVYRCVHMTMDDGDYIEWFKDKIDKLKNEGENVLYVVDEFTATARKFAKYDKGGFDSFISLMVGIASSGPSRRMFVWGIGQIPHAAAMGVSGGERAIFRPIAIANRKRLDMAEQFVGTSFVPSPDGGINGLIRYMDKSPRGRAIYYDGWEPMPELTNYSGFDRDRFEFIDPPAVVAVEEKPVEVEKPKMADVDVDIESALSFLSDNVPDDPNICTDFIDLVASKAKAKQNDTFIMFGELLDVLKELGHGTTLSAASLSTEKPGSAWASKWSRSTATRQLVLVDRSQKTITPFLEKLVSDEFKLLEKIDETNYKVTLR